LKKKREYDPNFIPQVSEISFHSKFYVIIHLMAVSALESCAHWINICLAVASLYFHVLTNAVRITRQSNCSVKTWRNTQMRSAQGDSTSVLTAKRLGSIGRGPLNTLRNALWWRYLAQTVGAKHIQKDVTS
jgi:hypothetical protein